MISIAHKLDLLRLPRHVRDAIAMVTENIREAPAWRNLLDLLAALGPLKLDPMAVAASIPRADTPRRQAALEHGRAGLCTVLLELLLLTGAHPDDPELPQVWAVWASGSLLMLPGRPEPLWWRVKGQTLTVTRGDRSLVLGLSLTWPGLGDDDSHALAATLYELLASVILLAQPQDPQADA